MKKITLVIALLCSISVFPTRYLVQLGSPDAATWRATGVGETLVDLTVNSQTLTAWLTATTFTSVDQVWIAAGTYNVTSTYAFPIAGLSIYGGFSGTETTTADREKGSNAWNFTNETIIYGNLATQIFTPGSARAGSIFDGLSITRGGSGGSCGIILRDGMTMQNCYLYGNVSTGNGGGALLNGGGNLNNCYFYNNQANSGGGIHIGTSVGLTSNITNCIFESNQASGGANNLGGGIRSQAAGTANITNCIIKNNSAVANGSAVHIQLAAATNFTYMTNCLIYGNTTKSALYLLGGTLYNCTVVDNIAGGAYLASVTVPTKIYNTVFWGTDGSSGFISCVSNAASEIKNSAYTYLHANYTGTLTNSIVLPLTNTIDVYAPYFVDPTKNIWTPTTGSSLIDSGDGSISGSPLSDLNGVTRAQGSAYDIGAYEPIQSSVNASGLNLTPMSDISVLNAGTLTFDANTSINSITIAGGGKVTLPDTKTLSTTNFSIQSDTDNGTGTFVDYNASGGLTVSGATTVNQYLSSTATGVTGRNWYISSPLSAALSSTITTATGNGLVYYDGTTNWPAAGTTMDVMTGYIAVSPAQNTTIKFEGGTLNTGNKSLNDLPLGFNLVGNPYPSYVNWTDATKSNITTSIWYRSKSTGSYLFQSYNVAGEGIGVNGGTDIIPPMQSFWIKTTSTTNSLGFANDMRSHQDQSVVTNRLKVQKVSTQKVLRLQVSNETNSDEAVIYFNENAQNSLDEYDTQKMFNNIADVPEIYTLVGTEKLVINGMNTIPYNTEIPLYFKANTSTAAIFTLNASELSNFEEGTLVYVKNNLSGEQQLISDGSVFKFLSSAVGSDPAFSVIFKAPGSVTRLTNSINQNINIYRNENNLITVNYTGDMNANKSVIVYNTVGQKLITKQLTESITVLDFPLSSGVYFVTVDVAGNKTTKKLIIN